MKRFFTIILFLPLYISAQLNADIQAYIQRYKEVAVKEMFLYKIPASITLAQGIHESTWGKSKLSLNSNNHFGIKCHKEWSGPTYKHDDDAPQECFRVYDKPEDSYKDHSEFLKTRSRYDFLFKLDTKDYKGWAKGLKAAGYATNPSYPTIIIKLIEDYHLDELDKVIDTAKPASIVLSEDIILPYEKKELLLSRISVNGVNAVVYDGKTDLNDIAQEFKLSKQKLLELNDRSEKSTFKKGENIFIGDKKEDCVYNQYIMGPEESLRDVSQKFGIKLDALCKRNNIGPNDIPALDEVLVLRGTREFPIHLKNKTTTIAKTTKTTVKGKYHTVDKSDTLFSISQKYGVSQAELKKWNGLHNSAIKAGQRLRVSL